MRFYWFIFLFLFYQVSVSQELPPIVKYSPEDYNADNQNWKISQSENKYIYVANNRGLLEFDGSVWNLYQSKNNSILRSVKVIGDRIYTGCYMEFGYWIKDSFGKLKYTSLLSKLNHKIQEDEQIWNILEYNKWVVFQSFHKIYFYNTLTDKFKIINSKNVIFNVYKIKDSIYYNVTNEGIYKIENGKPKLISSDTVIKNKRIISIFTLKNELIFLTQKSGLYKLQNNKVVKWKIEADNILNKTNNYCGLQLSSGDFIIGTISNGIIFLNTDGSIRYQINQRNGLSNNTILTLFEDLDNNLWIGLDNGINCINITSPIQVFNDFDGVLGTVYTSIVFKNNLYLGTNQGLFYKKINSKAPFKFIKGSGGQVWSLYNYKNEDLLCGHHLGTFIINEDKISLIDNTLGTWGFKPIPNQDNLLLKGNYTGLYVLEKKNGKWNVRNKISGFNNSSRFFEFDKENHIWVNHENIGVIKLTIDSNFTKAFKVDMESSFKACRNSSLVKYRGNILYSYNKGIYKYYESSKSFIYDSLLSPIIDKKSYVSGKLVVDKREILWAFPKERINYVTNDNITDKPKINSIAIPINLRKVTSSFENISLIKENVYLLGTVNGYLTINLNKINDNNEYYVFLNSITEHIDNTKINYDKNVYGEFKYKQGIIVFNFSVPVYYKYLNTKYQYKLEGFNNEWTSFSNKPYAQFENLGFGEYILKVRAKVGDKLSKNIISYKFKVNRPWFLSDTFLVLYLIFFILLAFITHNAYKRHYNNKLKKEQSENEKIIIQIKNQQLTQDIESKNRELTISKMSIIKKNEVLNLIKKELKTHEYPKNIKVVNKLINDNLNDTKDWELFVKAFKNIDKDFLEKIKKLHPNLNPNEIRFCVYLRLNLSSKEISNILNITVKSVETKRYRLRKHMNLPHEQNLNEYILNL